MLIGQSPTSTPTAPSATATARAAEDGPNGAPCPGVVTTVRKSTSSRPVVAGDALERTTHPDEQGLVLQRRPLCGDDFPDAGDPPLNLNIHGASTIPQAMLEHPKIAASRLTVTRQAKPRVVGRMAGSLARAGQPRQPSTGFVVAGPLSTGSGHYWIGHTICRWCAGRTLRIGRANADQGTDGTSIRSASSTSRRRVSSSYVPASSPGKALAGG